MTGCISARPASAAAAARTANGRRRNVDARNGNRRPGRTDVNAAKRQRHERRNREPLVDRNVAHVDAAGQQTFLHR
ncbi:MAG TPA: hypothetical protein VF921_14570, partial [Vicinamibacterales bacterium]